MNRAVVPSTLLDGAGQPAALRPREARHLGDRRGRGDRGLGLLDRHRPFAADRVPEQLVVVVEPVQGTPHRVADRVGVLAGDEDVRVADADAGDVAFLRDLHVGGRALGRGGDRDVLDRVDALVLVVVREAGRDLTEDAPLLVRAEVVGDDLGDREVAVVVGSRDRPGSPRSARPTGRQPARPRAPRP